MATNYTVCILMCKIPEYTDIELMWYYNDVYINGNLYYCKNIFCVAKKTLSEATIRWFLGQIGRE